VARRCILEDLCRAISPVDSDADFTQLKAALELSIRRLQRSFYTYRRLVWQAPVVRRYFLEKRGVWGLWKRIGDAILSQMKAMLDLSIRRCQRGFYTYRSVFWEVPVVRRYFLENRGVWGLWKRIGPILATQISLD
jgi:putative protein kinase ArgK-like GTPase of G3E family